MNNAVNNLEWCTSKYNNNYGRCKEKSSITQSININQYDLNNNFIKTWRGINNIQRYLKINKSNICLCCQGKRNQAGGFIWKYCDNLEILENNKED